MNTMLKYALGLSVLLNIAFFAAAAWLLFGGFIKLFIYPFNQRQISQFEMLGTATNDVVLLGDSLVAEGKWEELFRSIPMRNRGLPGDVTSSVLDRIDQVTKGQPAKIFLMVGINDIGMGKSGDEVAMNVLKIVERIRASTPGTRIFVHSILPNKPSLRKNIESANARIAEEIAGKAAWINLYPLFLDEKEGGLKGSLSNDGAHLTGKGYEIWKSEIMELVK